MVDTWKVFFTICTICLVGSECARTASRQQSRIRFPGPANIKKLPQSVLQRQEATPTLVPAPYPASGIKPEVPFELPTEVAANFPQSEPDLSYGPPANEPSAPETPDQTYGPPDQTYGPPDLVPEIPDDTYGPPVSETPDQTYGPPELENPYQSYLPPEQTYGVPQIIVNTNNLPESASIINAADMFFRPSQQSLPSPVKSIAFRPVRPGKLSLPNRPRSSKIIVNRPLSTLRPLRPLQAIGIPVPQTQLTLPIPERLITFRPNQFVVRRPSKPTRLVVGKVPNSAVAASAGFAQLSPAIKKPIFAGELIIGYSDRPQIW